ncbi:MAG: hypothetical protein HY318_15055 [Armatimonadetes bacterium]|nr:hypothetical protein [Armatimonadota bacterium]
MLAGDLDHQDFKHLPRESEASDLVPLRVGLVPVWTYWGGFPQTYREAPSNAAGALLVRLEYWPVWLEL